MIRFLKGMSSMETEMLIQAIEREPILLNFIVDKYKIQEILKKIFLTWNMLLIWSLEFFPDFYVTQKYAPKQYM